MNACTPRPAPSLFAPALAVCDLLDAVFLAGAAAARAWLAAFDAAGTVRTPAPLARRLPDPEALRAVVDRLNDAVEDLIAERDELRGRIAQAVFQLDEAPDINPDKAGKQRVREVVQANTRAWAVLTEGRDPPSVRRPEHAPRDG